MSRLGEGQGEVLAKEQEAIEKAGRELDVVVDHEQPVVSVERMLGEQAVEVLKTTAPFRWAGVDVELMTRAPKLGVDRARQLGSLGTHDSQREHAPVRWAAPRRVAQSQAPAAHELPCVERLVGDLAAHGVESADRAA